MQKIGHLIKSERTKQGWKQINLAKGICTASYLSKIESNSIKPSQEILELLLNRLGVSVEDGFLEEGSSEQDVLKKFKEMYFEVTANRNQAVLKKNKSFVFEKTYFFSRENDFYTYQLILFRLCLSSEEQNSMESIIKDLESGYSTFNDYQKYYFYKYMGIFYYQSQNTIKAIDDLEKSLHLLKRLVLEDWEIADFHYILGLVYLSNSQLMSSIEYITKALEFYKNGFYFNRLIDTYISMGIAYKRARRFEEALETFNLAEKVVNAVNLSNYKGILLQNMGALYSSKGESSKAINYFSMSLDKKEDIKGKIISLFSLINEYSKQTDSKQVVELCEKATALMDGDKTAFVENYSKKIEVYKCLHSNDPAFEETCIYAIDYFAAVSDLKSVNKFSLLLADYFYEEKKYKQAANYYRKSTDAIKNIMDIDFWEDL
ncbi:helix-turn-helix transcriptional regulator [Planomicrobium sp. CPCC 101079]|uniref:helix-turn-helix transcriptional regulator n=1 Tax=Planomicrobium sp. CPCC 101079 TaxID=2599618 RepID=UPI0011B5309C|nr:helix-turn-helix transcriptional regulator [Planomicrobium sp. CPCC 101079]TWT03614.1 helix-turn-helix transcriptional regulator [Planomicrobium sp. CPCC 101079]